ncbi:MAG: MazG-like family protein [Bifidobacterium sp.]|uniref:MazG nucleotide pyrophosphohydrolase domain-containing protein n=1 Tax=Bifidobacterium sp. TaxID=41200 RepID=UPI0039EA9A61
MNIADHALWLRDFYASRGWYAYPPFIRLAFLTEELGELSQAVRAYEIGRDHPHEQVQTESEQHDHIREELADVLDNVLILADKYGYGPDELIEASEGKLHERFSEK